MIVVSLRKFWQVICRLPCPSAYLGLSMHAVRRLYREVNFSVNLKTVVRVPRIPLKFTLECVFPLSIALL